MRKNGCSSFPLDSEYEVYPAVLFKTAYFPGRQHGVTLRHFQKFGVQVSQNHNMFKPPFFENVLHRCGSH